MVAFPPPRASACRLPSLLSPRGVSPADLFLQVRWKSSTGRDSLLERHPRLSQLPHHLFPLTAEFKTQDTVSYWIVVCSVEQSQLSIHVKNRRVSSDRKFDITRESRNCELAVECLKNFSVYCYFCSFIGLSLAVMKSLWKTSCRFCHFGIEFCVTYAGNPYRSHVGHMLQKTNISPIFLFLTIAS